MTRTHGSGGYQGAISSMISIVDVCPSCGKFLAEHRRQHALVAPAHCPDMIQGAFPFVNGLQDGPSDDPSSSPNPATAPVGYPPATDEAVPGLYARGARPPSRNPRSGDLLLMALSLASGPEDFP